MVGSACESHVTVVRKGYTYWKLEWIVVGSATRVWHNPCAMLGLLDRGPWTMISTYSSCSGLIWHNGPAKISAQILIDGLDQDWERVSHGYTRPTEN